MTHSKWDNSAIERLKRRFDAKLSLGADILVGEIQTRTPVDTGNLKGNTQKRKIKKYHYRAFNQTEYAPAVEFGTPPHTIRPKTKKALAFKVGGQDVVVSQVKHPGTTAQPFMRPGMTAAKPKIRRLMAK